jgi:hypothetical protein
MIVEDGMHCIDVCGKGSHEIIPPYDRILILKPCIFDST